MVGRQKRKTMESPSTDEQEVCVEKIAQIERLKHITKEEYLSLVNDRVAIPLRLQVKDASEGDLENYPCGIDLYTGLQRSGWVQSLQSFLKSALRLGQERSSDTIVLSIDESQENLADVVQALYTGDLELNNQTIESKLFIVDYMQIQVLVDPLMEYISHDLAKSSPEQVCRLHERFHLLRNSEGYSILECVCGQLSKGLHPAFTKDLYTYMAVWPQISHFIEKGDETFAKSIFEVMAPNVQCSLQVTLHPPEKL